MSKLFFSYRLRPDKDVFDVCSDKTSACFLVSLSSESLPMRDRGVRAVDGVVCKRDGIEEGRKGGSMTEMRPKLIFCTGYHWCLISNSITFDLAPLPDLLSEGSSFMRP